MRLAISILGGIMLLSGLASAPARAALGGNLFSVQKDAQALGARSGEIAPTRERGYDRYEILGKGIRLREFVGARGNVFALAWSGRRHPDLRRLLGKHFGEFQAALGQARREHRRGGAVVVDSGNLHLEIGGRMMSVYGVIWLKDQLPGELQDYPDEIR